MKLGSQKNQLLFPSQGSQALFFGNELDWSVKIKIIKKTPK
jgi:hypothetical protein